MNYLGNIPLDMVSLCKENPSKEEIYNDYSEIASHFKHPVFSSWVPTYDELRENRYLAWLKRYTNK